MGKSVESEKSRAPQFLIDALLPKEEENSFKKDVEEENSSKEIIKQLHKKAKSILTKYGKKEKSKKSTGHVFGIVADDPKKGPSGHNQRFDSFKRITILRTPPTEIRKGDNTAEIYLYAEVQKGKLPEIIIKNGNGIEVEEIATIQENGDFYARSFTGESFKEKVNFIKKTLKFIEKDLKSKK